MELLSSKTFQMRTQRSSFLQPSHGYGTAGATLGWWMESRWDSKAITRVQWSTRANRKWALSVPAIQDGLDLLRSAINWFAWASVIFLPRCARRADEGHEGIAGGTVVVHVFLPIRRIITR